MKTNMKKTDSMPQKTVISHRGRQNVVRTSVIHSVAPGATFLFLTHFDAVCDLSRECRVYILLDVIMRRRMAT